MHLPYEILKLPLPLYVRSPQPSREGNRKRENNEREQNPGIVLQMQLVYWTLNYERIHFGRLADTIETILYSYS